MRTYQIIIAVLLAIPVYCEAAVPTPTNVFGIYLFAEPVDWRDTATDWVTRALSPKPVISDTDIVEYRFTNHWMILTPEAAQRIARFRIDRLVQPFVVVANGERIYRGTFVSADCSMSVPLPTITLWGSQQFTIYTNLPPYTLFIERTYHAPFSAAQRDTRSDDRIRRTLEKLHKLK